MQNVHNVLKFVQNDGHGCLQLIPIDDQTIPDEINGESGLHIYHVHLLTELILKQLQKTGRYDLTEEDINRISIAASLHDIGKLKVPKSILDFPGKLSPVEYDIVKRHSVFGAELIEDCDWGDIDEAIVKHALEIAHSHHERVDGSGYPDGLKGDQIPLSAQVVALADCYDALTSNRSYKSAFSQDVALQMIAGGMSGVFRDELVDCLMSVVNHSTLVALREQLATKRVVSPAYTGYAPERILCIGNTEYLTKDFLEEAFPNSKVVVAGNPQLRSEHNLKSFKLKKPSVRSLFETYDFDMVVYFSDYLTYQGADKADLEELREVLEEAQAAKRGVKFLFLSSLDSAFQPKTGRAILSEAAEDLCSFYAKNTDLDMKLVQIPYLYSGSCSKDFLHSWFAQIRAGKTVALEEYPDASTYFISSPDLARLLARIIDAWKAQSGILTVAADFQITFSTLAEHITRLCGRGHIHCRGTAEPKTLKGNNKGIRSEYGWFARISILDDLEEEYEKFSESTQEQSLPFWKQFGRWTAQRSTLSRATELVLLFLVTELLLQLTNSAVIFSVVDFRMAYIVIMAMVHGLNYGLLAALLSSLSWLGAKMLSGTGLLTIFYEPTNWLPFAYFFLVATVCGYVKLRKDDLIQVLQEQNRLLEDKLVFTRELYEDSYLEKRGLKKQIRGAKDSFGKIFDISQKLNTVSPHQLYLRLIETFEDTLENKSVAVYSVNEQQTFCRLEAASRTIIGTVPRSVPTEIYGPIIQSVAEGNIWKNTDLGEDYPMYAAGVYRGDTLVLLIFLWRAEVEQYSLYYVNLFRILRDLVQMSLLRAYDYNQAIYHKNYIENTRIMEQEAFDEVQASYVAIAESKIASYMLMEIAADGRSYEELDRLLQGKIRGNDILGASADGNLRLLLIQATESDLPFILRRFQDTGLTVTIQ